MDDVFGASDDEVGLFYNRAPCGCGFQWVWLPMGVASISVASSFIGNVFHAETKETN